MARTRSNATQRIVMYWRDIPSMVTIKQGRERGKAMLPNRFQHAIDRAAMRTGLAGSDQYLEEWRQDPTDIDPVEGSLDDVAAAYALKLDQDFEDKLVKAIVKNDGFKLAE